MGSYGAETQPLREGTSQMVPCVSAQRKARVLGSGWVPIGWFCSFRRGSDEIDPVSVGKPGDWKFAGLTLMRTASKKRKNHNPSSSSPSALWPSSRNSDGQYLTGSHLAEVQCYLNLNEYGLMTEFALSKKFSFEHNFCVSVLNIQR